MNTDLSTIRLQAKAYGQGFWNGLLAGLTLGVLLAAVIHEALR